MRFHDLLQRITAMDHGPELAGLRQLVDVLQVACAVLIAPDAS